MMRSLFSAVAGLKAHQTKMDVIGNNISNVNTAAFKASRTTFRDVYYQTISGSSNSSGNMGGKNATQIGYGSSVASIDVLHGRAGYGATGNSMDCYIDGEGYFVVRDGAGKEHLTQVGTMGFDDGGNLVDGNLNFVMGYKVTGSTEKVSIGGASIDFGTANKDILDGYTVEVKYGTVATAGVAANSKDKTITVTVAPDTAPAPLSQTKETLQTALQSAWAWKDATGANNPPKTADGLTTFSGGAVNIKVDGAAATDTTRYDSVTETTGKVAAVALFDTSAPAKITKTGSLESLAIGSDGIITGQTDGKIVTIGKVCIADVPNPGGLTQEGGSYYQAVSNTGAITYHAPGSDGVGALETGGLEMSNVDLATELSDMIIAQRGFQANSKIITVADEMLDELVSMKR